MERKDKLAIGLCVATAADTFTTKIGLSTPGISDLNPLIENHYLLSSSDEMLIVKMSIIVLFAGFYALCRKWEDEPSQEILEKTLIGGNFVLWSATLLNTATLLSNR